MTEATAAGGFEIAPTKFKHPTLSFLHAYWDGKRGARLMPARADIKPAELKDHLGWISMLDVLPGDFRYRLIGTLVARYFGWDATGKTITEAWERQGRDAVDGVHAILNAVVKQKFVLRSYGEADWSTIGLEKFDSIYLPLSDDGETINVILHMFVFDRPEVLMAREIAKANGGRLVPRPASHNSGT